MAKEEKFSGKIFKSVINSAEESVYKDIMIDYDLPDVIFDHKMGCVYVNTKTDTEFEQSELENLKIAAQNIFKSNDDIPVFVDMNIQHIGL